MRNNARISVIIPVLNEEQTIAKVLEAIPSWVDEVIVADNGSTDRSAEVATAHGARVVHEGRRGYGSACLKGMAAMDRPDIVVFLDGDFSDYPEQMDALVDPIADGTVDMVIGSRVRGEHQPGALTPQARFGNWLACFLMRLFWGVAYTDLGPFRAIRQTALEALRMADPDYGWTVEMQIKAAIQRVPSTEVPVDYRKRIGKSKVSGTVRGVIGAGYKILATIFLSALRHRLGAGPKAPGANERIIIFTRYPEPGQCKTRLIPALGPEGAADLQKRMAERSVATAGEVEGPSIEIRYTGGQREAMEQWLGPGLHYQPQGAGDLGERMAAAFTRAFQSGIERVVMIGVDCPEITGPILSAAFTALKRNDAVLGPATDGGYYLIALRRNALQRAIPALFTGPQWGAETVLESTLAIAEGQRLRVHTLATLDDLDRPEDLPVWDRALGQPEEGDALPALSVIIPTLNEADRIQHTITLVQQARDVEILIADGGSTDGTQDIVRELGLTPIASPPGRARQMNHGAAKARADALLFLHGDTHLPPNYDDYIHDLLARPNTVAGAYRFATDDRSRTMRFIGYWANLRSTRLHMPYGDQGLFLKKDLFRQIGGFPDLPIMEDFEILRRLKKLGRIQIAPEPATTSARRWRRKGHWRTFFTNQLAIALYLVGVSPKRIARFYRH